MKCLSVKQPWAWLLVTGHKDIENRSWPTKLRGWVLVHAGLTLDLAVWPAIAEQRPAITLPSQFDIARGGIVGAMRIDDWAFEHPVPWRGVLGFFNVELHPEPAGLDLLAQIPKHVEEGMAR